MAAQNYIKPFRKFSAKIYVLTEAEGGRKKPFLSQFKPQFFFRTASVTGTIVLEDDTALIMPGDSLVVIIELIDH